MFIEPCLPTISRTVPAGSQWAYEIKHNGFRFLAVRQGKRVRVGGGHDWSKQLPAIAEALQSLAVRSVVLDGEGVICGPDGRSEFDRMRACFSRQGAPEAFLYAFDVLELDGRDLRDERWRGGVKPWPSSWPMPSPAFGSMTISRTWMARWCSSRRASWGRRALSPSALGTLPGMDQD